MKLSLKLPLAFAATLALVIAAALFGIHSLNQSIKTFETSVHDSHENAAAASHLLSQFKTQVQEWKNTLLRGRDAKHLMQLAWHIGNRHTPCQVAEDHLVIRRDPVIEQMLQGLGASLTLALAPFRPEGGAYGHGRTMGHDHGPEMESLTELAVSTVCLDPAESFRRLFPSI